MKQCRTQLLINNCSLFVSSISENFSKTLYVSVLVFVMLSLSNRLSGQSVIYNITESSAEYHRVQAWLMPFYADAYLANINMGWGAGARVSVLKNLQFTASFHKSNDAFDMGYRDAVVAFPVHNMENQDFKVTRNIDLGVNLVFLDKEKQRPTKVSLKESQRSVTYINPELKVRKLRYLRGGLNFYNTTLSSENLPDGNIVTDDYIFGIYGAYDKDHNLLYEGNNRLDWSVPMNTMTIAVGLGSDRIVNSTIEVTGYGTKYAKRTTTQYLDLLFAPIVNIEDLVFLDKKVEVSGSEVGLFKKSRLGVRYGIDYLFTRRLVSFGAGMEIGWRPGWAEKGFFLNGKIYMPLINIMPR